MAESAATVKSMKNQELIAQDNLAVNLEILRNAQEEKGLFLRVKDFLYKFNIDYEKDKKEKKIVEIAGNVLTLPAPELSVEEKAKNETLKQIAANTKETVNISQKTEQIAIEFDKATKELVNQNKAMVTVSQEQLENQKQAKLQNQIKTEKKKNTEVLIKQEPGKEEKKEDGSKGFFDSLKKLFSPVAFAAALFMQFLPWFLIFGAVLIGLWDGFSIWMRVKVVIGLVAFLGLLAFWKTGILQNWAKAKALALAEKAKMAALYALRTLNEKLIHSKKLGNLLNDKIAQKEIAIMEKDIAVKKKALLFEQKKRALATWKQQQKNIYADRKAITMNSKAKMANNKLERKGILTDIKRNTKVFLGKMKAIAIDIKNAVVAGAKKIWSITKEAAQNTALFIRGLFNKNQESIMQTTEHSAGMLNIIKEAIMNVAKHAAEMIQIAWKYILELSKFIKDMFVTGVKLIQAIAVAIADFLRIVFQIASTYAQYLLMAAAIILIVLIIAGIMILIVKVVGYLIKEIAGAILMIVTAIMPIISAIITPFLAVLIAVVATFTTLLVVFMTGVMMLITTYIMGLVLIICTQMLVIAAMAQAVVLLIFAVAALIIAVVASFFGSFKKKKEEKKPEEEKNGIITWKYLNNIDKKLNIFESYLEKIVGYLSYSKLAEDKNNALQEKVYAVQETNANKTISNNVQMASYQMTDNAAPMIPEVRTSKETVIDEGSENNYSTLLEKMLDVMKQISKNTKQIDKTWGI